jgi:hypothetical protein
MPWSLFTIKEFLLGQLHILFQKKMEMPHKMPFHKKADGDAPGLL